MAGVNLRLGYVMANGECLSVAYGHLLCVTFTAIDQVLERLAKVCRRVRVTTCLTITLFNCGIFPAGKEIRQ